MTNWYLHRTLTAVCLWLLPGCSWLPWFGKNKEPVHHGVISVRLNTPPPKGKRITYAAVSVHKGKRLKDAGFQRVSHDGSAAFVLPMDRLYDVRIFCDLNRNQSLDADEPNGIVQNLTPVPPTSADTKPVTLAFGVVGAVPGHVSTQPAPHAPQAAPQTKTIPPEAAPYMKHVPPWLQDKLLR